VSRAIGVLGAATLALTILTPTAARADHAGSTDPTGDVRGFTYEPEPAPCGTSTEIDGAAETTEDLTRVGVQHTRRRVVVTAHYADLDPDVEQILDVSLRASTGGYDLELYREAPVSGEWHVYADLSTEPVFPDPDEVPDDCGGITVISDGIPCRIGRDVRFAKDVVRLSVPRRCLGNPRWVRIGADAYHYVNHGVATDIYYDTWDNHGKELSPWLPPFGPRVHATGGATFGGGYPHPRATTSRTSHLVVRHGAEITRR
jgi:hypothetical protein